MILIVGSKDFNSQVFITLDFNREQKKAQDIHLELFHLKINLFNF